MEHVDILIMVAGAFIAWIICRKVVVPILLKVASKTDAKWDDVIFNRKVLLSAANIVPAVILWMTVPYAISDFPELANEYPKVGEALVRLMAIYITIMALRTLLVFIDSFKQLDGEKRTAKQQYLYTICGVLKIIAIFVAVIVVVAIIVNKDPSTLFAGLGAASAILMLAFQDTIKGLVAGIRLTTNEMLQVGDWITVPSAGANGRVEDITLTTVKVRNFDNTIITVSPQALVDGSFQNWKGMEENEGRKQTRQVYYDFRSIKIDDDGVANITKFRHHIEQWLAEHPLVVGEKSPFVRHVAASQAGCCLEFIFWLRSQAGRDFERDTCDIMEYIYAASSDFGLRIYQQFPEQ